MIFLGFQNQFSVIPDVNAQGLYSGDFGGDLGMSPHNVLFASGGARYGVAPQNVLFAAGMSPHNVLFKEDGDGLTTLMTCTGCAQTMSTCDWYCGPTFVNCAGSGRSGYSHTFGNCGGFTSYTCSTSINCGGHSNINWTITTNFICPTPTGLNCSIPTGVQCPNPTGLACNTGMVCTGAICQANMSDWLKPSYSLMGAWPSYSNYYNAGALFQKISDYTSTPGW